MAHAYTPGLKRKEHFKLIKVRRLPIPGEVLVKKGDVVSYDTIIARTQIPGDPNTVNVAAFLDIDPMDVRRSMLKKEGESIQEGELIAEYKAFFGLIHKTLKSPLSGTIEYISEGSGQVIVRGLPIPLELDSYVPGTIVKVLKGEGVEIEVPATYIQGIFGIGGETHGEIITLTNTEEDVLTTDLVSNECKGKIIVGGSMVEGSAIQKAVKVGAKGIVVGGVRDIDLTSFLGYEIGVAITGHEKKGLTLITTEGFGQMRMAKKTFELLKSLEGNLACINGATQIRAGVVRPEIIIPRETVEKIKVDADEYLSSGMVPGTPIRMIREPYFGALGTVMALPVEKQVIETESPVRVLQAKLEDGTIITIPRANVELIEE